MRITWRASARLSCLERRRPWRGALVSGAGFPAPEAPTQEAIPAQGASLGKATRSRPRASPFAVREWQYYVAARRGRRERSARPTGRPVTHGTPIPPSIDGDDVLERRPSTSACLPCRAARPPSGSTARASSSTFTPTSESPAAHVGRLLEHWHAGHASDARPGDLIVSSGHVAIYAGGPSDRLARPGKTIQFREIWSRQSSLRSRG